MNSKTYSICVVGGTGAEGGGLAPRWAKYGHRVTIGSRDVAKAEGRGRTQRPARRGSRVRDRERAGRGLC